MSSYLAFPPLPPTEAVYLCCTFPEVAFGGRYPLSLPCGARTFLMNRLSPCPRDCPVCSREQTYKPGSVSTVIYLGVPLPARSSHPGSGRASLYAPIPVLLRIEFTATVTFTRRRVSSYLAFPPLPRRCQLHSFRPAANGRPKSLRCTSSPHKN